MKDICRETGMSYETLKYYCNEGLVPNVKRDRNNRRVFDERDLAWLKSLGCLKDCGMGIAQMRQYVDLCMQGAASIPQRQEMLAVKREELLAQIARLQDCIAYIDHKQAFYADVLSGRVPYQSNLLPAQDDD